MTDMGQSLFQERRFTFLVGLLEFC